MWVGWCCEPSVCPLDQIWFICYDPEVWFLLRQNNPAICCYVPPLSCREHLLQSFRNISVLQSLPSIFTMPSVNRKTAGKNYRETRWKSSVLTYCPAATLWHREQDGMLILDPTPFQANQWWLLCSSIPKFSTCFSLPPCSYCLTIDPNNAMRCFLPWSGTAVSTESQARSFSWRHAYRWWLNAPYCCCALQGGNTLHKVKSELLLLSVANVLNCCIFQMQFFTLHLK